MYECCCCGREVVPKKLPGLGYWCDPCLGESTWREYPYTLDDEGRRQYAEAHKRHAAVCQKALALGPTSTWIDGR